MIYCSRCGIASNYPDISFDQNKVCNICLDFEQYHDKASQYFSDLSQLRKIISNRAAVKTGEYDCMMLFSGGKGQHLCAVSAQQNGLQGLCHDTG